MNITGPAPISPLQLPDEGTLPLRLNQRVAAEVLHVTGDRVTLALEGVQVVARLATPDGASALAGRRFAQFVVRDLSGPTLTLQLVQAGPEPGAVAPGPLTSTFLSQLLQSAGLPVNADTLLIARALLVQGLPLTPELLEELQQVISESSNSGASTGQAGAAPGTGASTAAAAAETAAALKALGLPLSAGTLALAGSHLPPLSDLLAGLRSGLRALLRGRPSARLAGLARAALDLADALFVDWCDDPAALAEKLKRTVSGMGRSLESELSRLTEKVSPEPGAPLTLIALARLRGELARSNHPQPLLDEIDRFLDGIRLVQFLNAGTDSEPARGQWLRLDLPLQFQPGQAAGQDCLAAAHLRIAYRPDTDPPVIDPTHTRLILRVDLAPGQVVQVDVSLADRRASARLMASTCGLAERARSELTGFQQALERLGYSLQNVRFQVSAGVPACPTTSLPFEYGPFDDAPFDYAQGTTANQCAVSRYSGRGRRAPGVFTDAHFDDTQGTEEA